MDDDLDESRLDDERRWQLKIADYEERLGLVAATHPQYAGGEIDYAHHAFYLYGIGQAPDDVVAIMREAPSDVTPHWVSVPYTSSQIEAACERSFDVVPHAHSAQEAYRFSGIVVEVDAEFVSDDELGDLATRATQNLGMPVEVRRAPPPVLL